MAYINREALLNELKEERKKGNFVFTTKWIKEIMDNLPAADVVEVVRCKDCKYGKGNDYEGNIKVPFMYFCTYDDISYNGAEHFCSNGKMKEGAVK